MDPVLYTVIVVILVCLLSVFLGFLCFGITTDCLYKDTSDNLTKYAFHRTDVEDLTNIHGDFKNINRISYRNEVSTDKAKKLLQRHNKSLSDIAEDSHSEAYSTIYSIDELIMANKLKQIHNTKENNNAALSTTNSSSDGTELPSKPVEDSEATNPNDLQRTKFKFSPEISSSIDNLEFCDPHAIDTLKSIHNIEEVARKIDREIDCFIGGVKNLKYFELNEKLIRCMIALSDTMCFNEDLRKRKSEALAFIGDCQKKLKAKVG